MTCARLAFILALSTVVIGLSGLAAGAQGWSMQWVQEWGLITEIRAPRTLGALLAGACLGLAGAIAQGLFRNPLADPYLLGSATGASLAVTLALALSALSAGVMPTAMSLSTSIGLTGAAFAGALFGVLLTITLAGGARRPSNLVLGGVVVGMILGAVSETITLMMPEVLRPRQAFMLGTTALLDWRGTAVLSASLLLSSAFAIGLSRALDALMLGEDTAISLGIAVGACRIGLIGSLALATGAAVAQTGIIGFVGLAAPHLIRRSVAVSHRGLLTLSILAGAVLLGGADVLARLVWAPGELPVGLVTALFGGGYLLVLLNRRPEQREST